MHDDDPSGTSTRRAALRLLISVLWKGKPLESALANAFNDVTRSDDRALARAITGGVLRWLPDLDDLIDGATAKRLPDDARARMVLRLALAQAILLDTPHHAVVATALPLVESGPRRLVHGVLSRLLREGAKLPETPTLPDVYAMRWHAAWGDDALEGLSRALAHEPPTDLALRDPARTAEFVAALEGTSLAPGHVRTSRKGPLTEWPGFAEGDWWVQDFAAGLPARLLGDVKGRRVADLCAAPGGKTMQLAAAGAEVIAVDINETRLARVRENLARTHLTAEVVAADAREWAPRLPVDDILLDAPCSATGIFRRHPDVLHLKGDRALAPLLKLQAELIDSALGLLTANGRLIYCVCSLEPEEGEHQIKALLARYDNIRIDPVATEDLPAGIAPSPEGWVRTIPGELDGFFIARLKRR